MQKNMPQPSARTGFVVGFGSKSQASPQIMLEHLNQLFKRTVSILNASLTLYVASLKCHFFSYNIVCANYPHHSLGFRAGSTL